jgi:hypothetical protein
MHSYTIKCERPENKGCKQRLHPLFSVSFRELCNPEKIYWHVEGLGSRESTWSALGYVGNRHIPGLIFTLLLYFPDKILCKSTLTHSYPSLK